MDTNVHFEAFLVATVNLKPWKLGQLDTRVQAIVNAIQNDSVLGSMYKEHIPQGSWAHETIIDPVGMFDEFDADFLLHLEVDDDWVEDPGRYLRELRAAFKRSSTYKDKVRKKNRCVRIGYAKSCHVDVVPHLTLSDGRQVIINYQTNDFEDTDPAGFTQWMKERDDLTGGNLRKVIRLMKYLRDFKNTFDCKSVILTNLLAGRVQPFYVADRYADIPTTLVSLLTDLDTWLDGYNTMPLLDDPSCPGTSFNHRWTEAKYQTFKAMIKKYAGWAREAAEADNEDDAILAWQKLFGSEFVAQEVKLAKSSLLASARHAVAKTFDPPAPGEEFIEQEGYPFSPRYAASIDARVMELYGAKAQSIRSHGALRRRLRLRFTLKTDAPGPFEVIWKVRNRGEAASRAGDLRGKLIAQNGNNRTRYEDTKYPGRHFIEVYVVQNGRVVASDHHEVHIR
jgi:hypothetical protein